MTEIRIRFLFLYFAIAVTRCRVVLESNYRAHSSPTTYTGGVRARSTWRIRKIISLFFLKATPIPAVFRSFRAIWPQTQENKSHLTCIVMWWECANNAMPKLRSYVCRKIMRVCREIRQPETCF